MARLNQEQVDQLLEAIRAEATVTPADILNMTLEELGVGDTILALFVWHHSPELDDLANPSFTIGRASYDFELILTPLGVPLYRRTG